MFSFPDLKTNKERTRIIIFATDNVVAGKETVSLEEACNLCKQYGINIYAYCPSEQMNIYTSKEKINSYKNAIEEEANGKFYVGDLEQMTSSMINEIKETKTSKLKTTQKTYITDQPKIIFIASIVVFFCLVILKKVI